MKKEEFKSGVWFKVYGELYEYRTTVHEGYLKNDGRHFANVERITDNGIKVYTFFFKKKVSVYIKFSEMLEEKTSLPDSARTS